MVATPVWYAGESRTSDEQDRGIINQRQARAVMLSNGSTNLPYDPA
jgi:hypothetical protein